MKLYQLRNHNTIPSHVRLFVSLYEAQKYAEDQFGKLLVWEKPTETKVDWVGGIKYELGDQMIIGNETITIINPSDENIDYVMYSIQEVVK